MHVFVFLIFLQFFYILLKKAGLSDFFQFPKILHKIHWICPKMRVTGCTYFNKSLFLDTVFSHPFIILFLHFSFRILLFWIYNSYNLFSCTFFLSKSMLLHVFIWNSFLILPIKCFKNGGVGVRMYTMIFVVKNLVVLATPFRNLFKNVMRRCLLVLTEMPHNLFIS